MNNRQLLFLVAIINIMMMFLLVHKQNIIIKHLYELQQLQEQKELLLQEHKELTLNLHKLTQLSTIEAHAKKNLNMKAMTLKDAHIISSEKTEPKDDKKVHHAVAT